MTFPSKEPHMLQLTAPLTKRQLELLTARKHLEHRLCADTLPATDYGLAARRAHIDAELARIEVDKQQVPV